MINNFESLCDQLTMYTLSVASIIWGYHEYKDVGLKDLVSFAFASASASGDRKIVIFIPQVSTHTYAKFLSGSWEF